MHWWQDQASICHSERLRGLACWDSNHQSARHDYQCILPEQQCAPVVQQVYVLRTYGLMCDGDKTMQWPQTADVYNVLVPSLLCRQHNKDVFLVGQCIYHTRRPRRQWFAVDTPLLQPNDEDSFDAHQVTTSTF